MHGDGHGPITGLTVDPDRVIAGTHLEVEYIAECQAFNDELGREPFDIGLAITNFGDGDRICGVGAMNDHRIGLVRALGSRWGVLGPNLNHLNRRVIQTADLKRVGLSRAHEAEDLNIGCRHNLRCPGGTGQRRLHQCSDGRDSEGIRLVCDTRHS